MTQRTFDGHEVAEILDHATRNPNQFGRRLAAPRPKMDGELPLAKIQSIGKHAGIPAEHVTAATRELIGEQATGHPELELRLRIPRGLTHRVPLPGPVEGEDLEPLLTLFRALSRREGDGNDAGGSGFRSGSRTSFPIALG